MFEKLFRRTRKIQALDLNFGDMPEAIVDLETFQRASKHQLIYETDQELSFINEDGATRYIKPNAKPPIVKTQNIQIHPDHVSARITVDKKTLFKTALRERVFVVETPTEYIIPLGVSFICPKKKD